MVNHSAAITPGISWTDKGTSITWDLAGLAFAIALHAPLFFMKIDDHKKAIDKPSQRLVAVDLIEPELPKPVEEAPPPPVVKENSLMERLKALVKKEPPPPPLPEKKIEPQKLADISKPIELQPKLDLADKLQPARLESKSGFKTQADPKIIEEQQLAMNTAPVGIAPMSAKKLGTLDDRTALKSSKGSFQVSNNESLKGIGGDGPGLSGAAPVIAIKTGRTASTEKFSAPVTQMSDKGRIGAIAPTGLGDAPQLGLRDSIIARDAKASQINVPTRSGGAAGGVPGGTGTKRDAGSFSGGGTPGGLGYGAGSGSISNAAPTVAATIPKKKEKQSMFVITGELKDRKILKQVPPEYPAWAQEQGISAAVILEFTVDPEGTVKNTIVVRRTSGYPKLDETAIQALRQWKFAPLADGENREEVGMITFNYSLN